MGHVDSLQATSIKVANDLAGMDVGPLMVKVQNFYGNTAHQQSKTEMEDMKQGFPFYFSLQPYFNPIKFGEAAFMNSVLQVHSSCAHICHRLHLCCKVYIASI